MSAGQVIAMLAAAAQKLDETQARLQAAGQAASEARTLVASALEGGSGQLVAQLDQLREVLSQVSTAPAASREQVQATIAKVQALGN